MARSDKVVCIFGGTGFLGHYITQELARAGYRIKIATRHPESAYDLKVYGSVGQIAPYPCDYKDESIERAVKGSDIVINLIGILAEKKRGGFHKAHAHIPEVIAKACTANKVHKFLHVSALGIDDNKSKYAQTKREGEAKIKQAYPAVTIFRPSLIFGPGDAFFNRFAKLSTYLPALPLIGGGKTRFQPVYAGDIADAALKVVSEPSKNYESKTFALGGPDVVTFKQIYEILLNTINRERALVPVPWFMAKIQGAVLGMLPNPPLTVDQVKSLLTDNIVMGICKTFDDLGITPTAMKLILPRYLATFRRGGRFASIKTT
jgi:NADH dehydrogenase